jgi:aldose 1-epimerase
LSRDAKRPPPAYDARVPATFSAEETTVDSYEAVRLASPDGSLAATFAPRLGMIGCSLEHDGEELLGQRGGLARYESEGSTMGIPLLHPWANRLAAFEYTAEGRHVVLDRDSPLLHIDGQTGLPIHGVLAASPHWEEVATSADDDGAELSARLDFGAHPDLLEAFPFPHRLRMQVVLDHDGLSITTTVDATADAAVPVCFGFHPYLQLPGLARAEWEIDLPVQQRVVLDDKMIPTRDTEPVEIAPGPLGDRTFDDGFCDLAEPAVFALAGGGRRIEVEFGDGFQFAQVFAPPDQDVICFEPMTAATNALASGWPRLPSARPGNPYGATFRIRVLRP